ncbi:DUF7548 family protein [Haladaptatus pallidirubidus]|uniref:Uncharacterized protein n=1 Tax=Haladaptatus pallidirubidus TaxID=1008152 RepID=A0AAV3UBM9_9EURY|nr:hypothetical protein [Haladaptatus pallidirubidus]
MSKRLAPKVGIVSCLVVLLLLSLPYFLAPATAVGAYYGTIPVPVHLLDTFFALVAIIAFGSGLKNRSDPATVAGVALVLGAFMAVITLWWAVVTPADTLVEAARMDSLSGHRWAFALVTLAVPISAGWYARSVL